MVKNNNEEIKYTDQQKDAIESNEGNIIVSAAAGSGKTMILVDRVVRLMIHNKVDIENFLIVTFTNAAANQMVEKIREKLIEKLGSKDDRFIRRQLQNMNNANISTMHSFCIKILREYYEFIGLSPDFKIANNSSAAVIKNNALEASLEKEYEEGCEDFIKFFDSFAYRNEDIIANLIENVHYKIQAQIDPISWLEKNAENLTVNLESIVSQIRHEVLECKELIEISLEISNGHRGPKKYIDTLEKDLLMINSILDLTSVDNFDELISAISAINHDTIGSISSKADKEATDMDLKDLVLAYRNESKEKLQGLKTDLAQKDKAQISYENEIASSYLHTLTRLVKSYDNNLKKIKEEENLLDISDIESLCLKLLNIEEIQEKIRNKLVYIFYDEYQDINPIQEAIINKIKREDNLFFVGDMKQSIYKFRLADPSLFTNRIEEYQDGEEGKVVNLTYNFRSSPNILNFLNVIFENIMSPEHGGVTYDDTQKLLIPENKKDKLDKGQVKVILNEKAPDLGYNDLTENSKFIAEEILKLVKEGYEYKDIVILMRNVQNRIGDYEDALDYYDIPYFSDNSNISLEDPEVSIVIDFLRVINNYRNDEALISVLLTPIGKMTEEELADIKIYTDKDSFYESMLAYNKIDGVYNKIYEFFFRINAYRKELYKMKFSDFVYYILSDSGYFSYIASSYLGDEKIQNILAFIDRVREYEEMSYCTLANFLRYVDTLLNSPKDSLEPTKLLSDQDNVVRIMTIHKSKGLQFPVVFMTDMQSSISLREKRDDFIVDDELGIGIKIKDNNRKTTYKTLHRKVIEKKKEEENSSEEVRLFYVGTTRAKEKLYLVAYHKNPSQYLNKQANKPLNLSVSSSSSMMDWYMIVLLHDRQFLEKINKEIKDGKEIDLGKASSYFSNIDPYSFEINEYEKASRVEVVSSNIEYLLSKGNEDDFKKFEKIFNFEYPNQEKTKTPFKSTVSELSAKNRYKTDDTAEFPKLYTSSSAILEKIPNILINDREISPAKKGSLVHFVFQNISYENHNRQSVIEEINRMVNIELLTKEEAAILDPDIFVSFFKTNLAKRALENINTLNREVSFTMKYDDIYLDGQIDAFFQEVKSIIMYDFKTDVTISEKRYKSQMAYYKEAIEEAYGLDVSEIYIYWTNFNKTTLINC